ncbi:hypothetical protein D3C80_1585130 [compost metagenome]
MLQRKRFYLIAVVLIHLPNNIDQPIHYSGSAGDQQRVTLFIMRHAANAHAVIQLTQQWGDILGRHIAQRDNAHYNLIAFRNQLTAGLRQSGSFPVFRHNDFKYVIWHTNDGISVHVQHIQEELIILFIAKLLIATYGDLSFHRRINNDRFAQIFTDRVDKFLNIRTFEIGRE